MSDESLRYWVPFEEIPAQSEEVKEPVLTCYLGKICHFSQGRNAYWGRWSRTYPGHDAFVPNLAEAKGESEHRRVQGAQWTIRELPVLVIAGQNHSLIVGEINTSEPLADFLPLRKRLSSLEQFGQYFRPRRGDSIFRMLSEVGGVRPAALPFWNYWSVSTRGAFTLRWRATLARTRLKPVVRLVSQINTRLQRQ